jgi:hypothetical protein
VGSAQIAAAVNPAELPVYAGATGTLEGTVYVEGEAAPLRSFEFSRCARAREMFAPLFRSEGIAPQRRPLLDAVVGITGYAEAYIPASAAAIRVEIKDCILNQRTFVLTFGQALEVFNREPARPDKFYALDLTRSPGQALMVVPPQGEPTHVYPRLLGHDVLTDKMDHPYMTADIYVTRQPLNAVTTAGGRYRIEGVPVGDLQASAFHPAFAGIQTPAKPRDASARSMGEPVTIRAGEITRHDLVLRYDRGAEAGRKSP